MKLHILKEVKMVFISCILFALFFPMIVVIGGLKIIFKLLEKLIDFLFERTLDIPGILLSNITGKKIGKNIKKKSKKKPVKKTTKKK